MKLRNFDRREFAGLIVAVAIAGKVAKMSGFSDPVVGGIGTLIRQMIKSPNYSPGIAGWSINRDGSAEFNNLTIRGTFNGTDFIVNSSGAFFYSSAPANGNLIASIAALPGTDGFGNAYIGGFATYNSITGQSIQITAQLMNFIAPAQFAPAILSLAAVFSGVDGLQISSPMPSNLYTQAFLAIVSGGSTVPFGIVSVQDSVLELKTSIPSPQAGANGTRLYVNNSPHLAMIDQSSMQLQVPGAQLATFPGTVVTAAALTNLATMTIPANDAEAGSCYEVESEGSWTEATGTATTFQFGAAFGGTNLANQIIGTTGFNAGGTGRYTAKARVYCISSGVSATWQTTVWATVTPNANPNNSVTICDDDAGTITTLSSTVNRTLALRFAWGTTTGSPSINNRRQIVKRIC